jgi:hypothetical protein
MCVHRVNQNNIESTEDTMNARAMMVAAAMMTALTSPAPGQETSAAAGTPEAAPASLKSSVVRRIEKNYMACLTSANEGVVESAIAQSVRMKWALPSAQLEDLRLSLGKLAVGGMSVSIRYKAYLAELVYDSPSIFNPGVGENCVWDEDLFAAISSRAQKVLLGYNGAHPRGF